MRIFLTIGEQKWQWTGGLLIDVVGEIAVRMKGSDGSMYFARVEILLESATLYIIFKEENAECPPYRIVNNTYSNLFYRQKGTHCTSSQY